jgi:hypothetical protein
VAEHDSKIAYFRIELSNAPRVTREMIRETVENGPWHFSDEDKEEIIRNFEHTFDITQTIGSALKSVDFKPWLEERKQQQGIDFFYWNRLKRYYLEKGVLPPNVVATLDTDTDEILDYSGNPETEEFWPRRGMVMGHVQSGKTTNYSALICKAADAGYKIIILLAGITNLLRQQTQERLDETFIGKKSVFQAIAQEPLSIINYSDRRRFPAYGTSRDRDFLKAAASTYGVSLSSLNEPIIFVTKKNKTTLGRLRDWLKEQNLTNKINDPLLLIDDEADNASINTEADPKRVTAINGSIREILSLFNRSTYIGYTATPFANIFIDPESEHDMLEDDLFPRHFIKALEAPSNYSGATRIFQESGDLRLPMVRTVDDFNDILPLKHKRDHDISVLPGTLAQAIRVFLLTRGIRVLRGDANKSCSMMINVTRFNDVQELICGLVYQYVDLLKNSIVVNSGLGVHAAQDANMNELKSTYEEEFLSCGFSFLEILKVLPSAVSSITIRTVNMRGGVLDYSHYKDTGLHIIAIGGLALSRGLTLEGLTVSYILRNASASDTLMQMARWFGFRPGYEDICRLYLPEQSCDHYEFITDAIEELRSEINRMKQLRLTPIDFGLRVRHDPTAIRITAANKMRTATKMTVAQDYSGRHLEGWALYNDDAINRNNLTQVQKLIGILGEVEETDVKTLLWRNKDASIVFQLLQSFKFPEVHPDLGPITGNRSLFLDYFSDRLNADLAKWDVALPLPENKGMETVDIIPGQKLFIRSRKAGIVARGIYRITSKNRVANPGDEQIGLELHEITSAKADILSGNCTRGYCAYSLQRKRPLLLIHAFFGELKDKEKSETLLTNPIISLSLCLPATRVPPVERWYQVNTVYRNQLLELASEPDDDEKMADEVDDV